MGSRKAKSTQSILLVAGIATALGLLSGSAPAVPIEIPPFPPLVTSLRMAPSPRKLPAHTFAPVRWHIFGKIGTSTGKHPPALREIELDVDKDVKIADADFPSCGIKKLNRSDTRKVMTACRGALLGRGEAHLEIATDEGPASIVAGRLLVFNGGSKGGLATIPRSE
jgi:hypothetical protein